MSRLDDATKIIAELKPEEKASLVQFILHGLESSCTGIENDPAVCGGDPCIARTRIPVWVLVSFRRKGMSESDILKNYPTLTAADVVNAWTYYANHRNEIEDQISRNEEE